MEARLVGRGVPHIVQFVSDVSFKNVHAVQDTDEEGVDERDAGSDVDMGSCDELRGTPHNSHT